MEIGVKDPNAASPKKSPAGKKVIDAGQTNTLDGFFKVKQAVAK